MNNYRFGNSIRIFILCIVILISCGCASNSNSNMAAKEEFEDNQSLETYESANEANPRITIEDNEDFDLLNLEEDNEEEEEVEEDGVRFYDLGPKEITTTKDNPFVEPILINPTNDSVTVMWFSMEPGDLNEVIVYETSDSEENLLRLYDGEVLEEELKATRVIQASTSKMSRIRGGKTDSTKDNPNKACDIYKHIAVVDNLPSNHGLIKNRVPYKVRTDDEYSGLYTLTSRPVSGTSLRILLTSDHQIKPMTAANIQKVYETVGAVDAILVNGDIVDVIDRAYDWFFTDNAFWRVMTGTANDKVGKAMYKGAPLVQQAPIYTTMGNHDVMGVYDNSKGLDYQFNNPRPRDAALREWETYGESSGLTKEEFIENRSYNTITYNEMFGTINGSGNTDKYYATSIGDVRLISLDVNRVWRLANIGLAGKYSEIPGMGEETYGYGDFIFERVDKDSDQIKFLKAELETEDYKESKYKVAMFHHEAHSLGSNQVPAFTDSVAKEAVSPVTGQKMVIYDYPIDEDYIINVIEPILEEGGVNLLFEAHSHVWNRFKSENGMNILETSNVGNSYGGFYDEGDREFGPSSFNKGDAYYSIRDLWDADNYILKGDPNGLSPISPSVAELPGGKPYLSSNTITAFSILDTDKGAVLSYYFDTENPDEGVVLFDSFDL